MCHTGKLREREMKMTTARILALLLMTFVGLASADDIRNYHSGSWYDPDHSGHGISVEVVDDETLVVFWFAYHPDGTPMWLLTEAVIEGDTATGDAWYFSGMPFGSFDPGLLGQQRWGTVSLTFLDCHNARLSYDSPMSHGGIPFGAGEIDLVRLTFIDGLDCTPPAVPEKFGNFSSGLELEPWGGWPINSFAWIAPSGTLAYQFVKNGEAVEIGYGQLTLTGESAFRFEAVTSNGNRESNGEFRDGGVILDLQELGVFEEPLDPSYLDAVTHADIAGRYSGPDAIFVATVGETGEINGSSIGGEFHGWLTITEPGFNQLAQYWDWELDSSVTHGLGVLHRDTGHLFFIHSRGDDVWAIPWFRGD